MPRETILFISNQKMGRNAALAAAEATGYRVLITNATQAPALLFIMHCLAAILLDDFGSENDSFDLARNLRVMCRDIPIILLSPKPIKSLPVWVDAGLNTHTQFTTLVAALLRTLSAARETHLVSR